MSSYRIRTAFSLVELLVALAIVGVLLALLLPAIQMARESASRVQCINNLHQAGVAFWAYHDEANCFPQAGCVYSSNAFVALTHLLGQTDLRAVLTDPARVYSSELRYSQVRIYSCPSRRPPTEEPVGIPLGSSVHLKGDYALSMDDNFYVPSMSVYSLRVISGYPASANAAVTNMSLVNSVDGLGTTLLLSHKGVRPKYYTNPPPTCAPLSVPGDPDFNWDYFADAGWNLCGSSFNSPAYSRPTQGYTRKIWGMWRDSDADYSVVDPITGNLLENSWLQTSPHADGAPCLFGDGSVRSIAYSDGFDTAGETGEFWLRLWCWNDGRPAPITWGDIDLGY